MQAAAAVLSSSSRDARSLAAARPGPGRHLAGLRLARRRRSPATVAAAPPPTSQAEQAGLASADECRCLTEADFEHKRLASECAPQARRLIDSLRARPPSSRAQRAELASWSAWCCGVVWMRLLLGSTGQRRRSARPCCAARARSTVCDSAERAPVAGAARLAVRGRCAVQRRRAGRRVPSARRFATPGSTQIDAPQVDLSCQARARAPLPSCAPASRRAGERGSCASYFLWAAEGGVRSAAPVTFGVGGARGHAPRGARRVACDDVM